MPRKPKKPPWSVDLPLPSWAGGPKHAVEPMPSAVHPSQSTPPMTPAQWECLRCEQIREGYEPTVPDHSPRCSYRGVGRDPEPKG